MIAWYYVFVGVVLLAGQQYFLTNSHLEAVTKLTAQYEHKLRNADLPAAAAVVPQAAPAVPAPAAAAAPAPAPAEATAKATPAAKDSTGSVLKTIFASSPKARARPKPVVPAKVTFRSEPFEKARIVLVTNTSAKAQAYTLKVVRPSTGESDSFEIKVPPAVETPVNGADEWAFRKGDRVEIAAAGFASKSVAIP